MNIEDLQAICKKFPATTEDIKWGHDLCFCVGAKMYCVTGLDETPTSASFKVPDDEFQAMCERDGFQPAPYMARHKWVSVDDLNRMTKTEWQQRLKQSYDLVKDKLSTKLKRELGFI